jgi:predicted secreted protein
MASGLVNATDLVLKLYKAPLGYRDIAYATTFDLEVNAESIDQTNKSSEGWHEMILGARNWSISCDALYQNESNPLSRYFVDAFGILDNRTKLEIQFTITGANAADNNKYYSGSCQVVSLNLKGDTEDQAVYQIFLASTNNLNEVNI